MAPPGSYPIQRAGTELGLQSIGGPPWPPVAHDVDGWIGALGSLPLVAQPGEQWLYNTSIQVLGVLLARACSQDLESVLRARVLEPLGMIDTGFTVPAEHLSRLSTFYLPDSETGGLTVLDDPTDSWWSTATSFPDASGWLVSTIDDYWSFVSMLLARGTRRGERILSPATVALMTTDRLTPANGAHPRSFSASTAAGAWGWPSPPPGGRAHPCRAGSGGTVAAAPPGAPTFAPASPGSCSRNARPCPPHRLHWSRTSGPASTPSGRQRRSGPGPCPLATQGAAHPFRVVGRWAVHEGQAAMPNGRRLGARR